MRSTSIMRGLNALVGANLALASVWFGAANWWWLFPLPSVPDNHALALGLAMVVEESTRFVSANGGFSGGLPKSVGFCGFGPLREIYYFRALAPGWDFRAQVLDWRLRGQAIPWLDRHEWDGWTWSFEFLQAGITEFFSRGFGRERMPAVYVGHDCARVSAKSPDVLVTVVGVSPVVTAGWWARSWGEGQVLFLAIQVKTGTTMFERVYAVGLQPLGELAAGRGRLRPWVAEVGESFWHADFGGWPRAGWRPY